MTELLTEAVNKASRLSAELQDDLARRLLDDLAGEPQRADADRMRNPPRRAADDALASWARRGWLTPPRSVSQEPPMSLPVAPLHELLKELEDDRDEC